MRLTNEYWYIPDVCGMAVRAMDCNTKVDEYRKSIGNYFWTREEALEYLERLKGLKKEMDKRKKDGVE